MYKIHLPNSSRRRARLEPVTFVPVSRAFKAQVKVRATRDLSGWASRDKRVKWHIGHGRVGCMDEDKAREFAVKGFVEILDGEVKPVSEQEAAEFLSHVTVIGPGAGNGS